MTRLVMTIEVERDLMDDLLSDWERIGHALVRRHGEAFRALDRRMHDIEEGITPVSPWSFADIDRTTMVLLPPPEMLALVADARRLGVI